jgi:hypothetical protein
MASCVAVYFAVVVFWQVLLRAVLRGVFLWDEPLFSALVSLPTMLIFALYYLRARQIRNTLRNLGTGPPATEGG